MRAGGEVGRDDRIEALLGRCPWNEGAVGARVVALLASHRDAVAAALRGRSLRVHLRVDDPAAEVRLVLLEDGSVVDVSEAMLLDAPFDPEVRLTGTPAQLLAVAVGATALEEAVEGALLLSRVPLPRLVPLRDVVAAALGQHE